MRLLPALILLGSLSAAGAAQASECKPSPLGDRPLFLRGGFNGWTVQQEHQFRYVCNRYELLTELRGRHKFKIGDEPWSRDADFGAAQSLREGRAKMTPIGKELEYDFNGNHRVVLDMSQSASHPELRIESCASAPLGDAVIYLRGGMNQWTANEDYAFRFRCDAYYLNVKTEGLHEFRIADPSWTDTLTFAAPSGPLQALAPEQASRLARISEPGVPNNLRFEFRGEHTLRLAFDGGAGQSPSLSIGPKSFDDAASREVDDPIALSIRFDSRDTAFKSPFGPVVEGSALDFSFTALPGIEEAVFVHGKRRLEGNQEVLQYEDSQRLPMRRSEEGDWQRWSLRHAWPSIGVYGYHFEVRIGDVWYVYQNNDDVIPWTRERGTNGIGQITYKPESDRFLRRFRQTVHLADYTVPAWAKDVVYYYIFPERFRNGDRSLDPKPGVTGFHGHGKIELHEDWNGKPYRPDTGDGSDAYYNNDFFGGDLIGIIDKLDYIKRLGANTIYMTPIFHAVSNHKYDTADYTRVDPHFGSNADFERLTREAGKRGLRVLMDASLNHTGADSIYFDRWSNFGGQGAFSGQKIHPESPYFDWYSFDPSQTEVERQYKGWVGVRDLPELNKSSAGFRAFAFGDPDSVMKRWLDRGASGWRMDVAPWVPDDFWRAWRPAIKNHRPDALTVAESFFDSSKFFLGDTFDSTMNYIFRNAVVDIALGKDAREAYRSIEYMREVYPAQSFYALMNLLSSHDQPRTLHVFGDHGDESSADDKRLARERYRLALFIQMTFPGAPAIYYGDEVGVTGGEDPFNRQTYPWKDAGGRPDEAMYAWFQRLVALRNDNPVLRHGSIDAPIHLDENVIVWWRDDGRRRALVAVNNSADAKTVTLSSDVIAGVRRWTDALSGEKHSGGASLTLTVPARDGLVWVGR